MLGNIGRRHLHQANVQLSSECKANITRYGKKKTKTKRITI